ncbi:MAG: hypothetical protein FWD34_07690 [Oscillospiraceae bacterium]|nr:hypothetical protein [Oscillospiraceae bacterium]
MHKKILTRIVSVIIITAVFLPTLCVPASAAVIEWDGKSTLQSGNTYTVNKELFVSGNVDVPKGVQLFVYADGRLVFTSGSSVTVSGELAVAQKGEIFVSGNLLIKEGGTLGAYGSLLSSLGSKIEISGSMTVYNKGEFKSSGEFVIYKSGNLTSRGSITILKSGEMMTTGVVAIEKSGKFIINGYTGITLGGLFTNSGSLTVGKNGRMVNSGTLIIEHTASFTRTGKFSTTKSGSFIDKGTIPNYDAMAASGINSEKAVRKNGIDISHWNGTINWQQVAASGIDFVMIRAGRGHINDSQPMIEDTRFREHLAGAQANGIEVGVYFYSYAKTVKEAQAEARFLVNILKDCKITYPVALDMEEEPHYYTGDKPQKMAEAFLKIIMDHGYFPMMYSYKSWLETNLDNEFLNKYAVWVAHVNVSQTNYKGNYQMWQYSWVGRVSGINGDVDLNIAYRDFAAYIKKMRLNNL